ncbi:MAG TPA: nucleoside hydrolase [Tepidisphaeraceae bacterium]|nr:nucleoside hydrolase [Tepidisphaeraceae bacterium]
MVDDRRWVAMLAVVWAVGVGAVEPAKVEPAGVGKAGGPERIILDTDLGDDVDDAGTLAVMHALLDRGEIQVLAVGVVNGHVDAVPCADAINTWYGRPNLPIGSIAKERAPIRHDRFKMKLVTERYAHDLTQATAPDVVGLYRRVLAAQPDKSVSLVVVGQATNVADLLKSKADEHSPLDGVELVRRKVKFYAAGGNGRATLPDGQAGWNYQNDREAAWYELENLPSDFPTVFAGGSGLNIKVGRCYREAAQDHIVRKLYENYFKGVAEDRPTWDQIRLLYAARPAFREWFDRSANGSVTLDRKTGRITWKAEPDRNRSYAYVKEADRGKVVGVLTELMMHAPVKKP